MQTVSSPFALSIVFDDNIKVILVHFFVADLNLLSYELYNFTLNDCKIIMLHCVTFVLILYQSKTNIGKKKKVSRKITCSKHLLKTKNHFCISFLFQIFSIISLLYCFYISLKLLT